jgi:hypothetical protein
VDNQTAQYVRQALAPFRQEIIRLRQELDLIREQAKRPKTVQEEIDAIPGRRIFFTLSNTQTFDSTNDGTQGPLITMQVSQDGPYIMTHYPTFMWRPSAPAGATNFGVWRPVSSWPLPDQVIDADLIDISYQFADSGPGRNFQNAAVPPALISRPDNLIPLPVPTLFTPNTTIQLQVTYENILFNGSTPPTQGTLVVALPGYKIVNL